MDGVWFALRLIGGKGTGCLFKALRKICRNGFGRVFVLTFTRDKKIGKEELNDLYQIAGLSFYPYTLLIASNIPILDITVIGYACLMGYMNKASAGSR